MFVAVFVAVFIAVQALVCITARRPMDVISELIGVPVLDRDELRIKSCLVVHREEGVHGSRRGSQMPLSRSDS